MENETKHPAKSQAYSLADPQPASFAVFEKAERYKTRVEERLRRATQALDAAGVSYAVIGGNAVMTWIVQADESAVRHTQDVDLLLDASEFDRARKALESAGFVYRQAASLDMFLDGADGKAREALHVVFAGQKVRPEHLLASPVLGESVRSPAGFLVLNLPALVRMKLTSFRLKDQVHLQDLASVGLIDSSWLSKVPEPLVERLRYILENPDA